MTSGPAATRDTGPQSALLPDGRRLHLQYGPIDLIIEAWGDRQEVVSAYWQAQQAFRTVLPDLVGELEQLRQPAGSTRLAGPVAKRMSKAVDPHTSSFVTPMAAVAGAVADHMLEALCNGRNLQRAYVNNGGDIAIHLSQGQTFTIGIAGDIRQPQPVAEVHLASHDNIKGIATSGWHGRSFSLGIADAVTVLAADAARADVAATLIANAIDLPDSGQVHRQPATDLQPDSDLGDRLVTIGVEPLTGNEVDDALSKGAAIAEVFRSTGEIEAAFMYLQGRSRVTAKTGLSTLTQHESKCSQESLNA